jgi:hypothetical protein
LRLRDVSLNVSEDYSLFRFVSDIDCVAVSNVSFNALLLKITARSILTARYWETVLPLKWTNILLHALIEILTVASKQDPFSVGWLHSRVLSRLKCWSPSVKPLAGGGYVYERQPRRTPIYSLLSETRPRRSIVLGPLPIPSNKQESGEPMPIEPTSSSYVVKSTGSSNNGRAECLEEAQRSKKVENSDGLKELTKVQCPEQTECAQILLAIRVDETPFNQ